MKKLLLLLLVIPFIASAMAIQTTITYSDQQTSHVGSSLVGTANLCVTGTVRAQWFRMGVNGYNETAYPTKISIPTGNTSATGTKYIRIRNANATGYPSGADIVNGSFNGAGLVEGWNNFTVTTHSPLLAGKDYFISLDSGTDGSCTGGVQLTTYLNTTNMFSGGSQYSYSGGAWTPVSANDLYFIVFGEISSQILSESLTYNSTTYYTDHAQTYLSNVSMNATNLSSAYLSYNGQNYTATLVNLGGYNYSAIRSITTIPQAGSYNIKFYYVATNGSVYPGVPNTLTVANPNVTLCSSSGIKYINFTFKDELTLGNLNGSFDASTWNFWLGDGSSYNTYLYQNLSYLNSYAFCFTPADRTFDQDTLIQYSASGYPQRRWTSTSSLSNSTINQTLYLLGSSSGIYSSIQVTSQLGTAIPGATVILEKQISGTWTTLSQQETDGSGLVTFWVDPNSDHRISVSASGYASTQVTIRPTQSVYTIVLSGTAGNATYTSQLEGISWYFKPNIGLLRNNASTQFNVTIVAERDNLVACEFRLVNTTANISSTTSSCSSAGGFLTLTYTPKNNEKIWGVLYVNLGEGMIMLDGDAFWVTYNYTVDDSKTLKNIFSTLKNFNEFGEGVEQEFSRIVFFFVVLSLAIGIITYMTGADSAYPGIALWVIFGMLWFASLSDFFVFQNLAKQSSIISAPVADWIDTNGYIFILSLFFLGYFFNSLKREG